MIKKTIGSITVVAFLGLFPVVPQDMTFTGAYCAPYVAPQTITTATGTIAIGSDFPDGGDGEYCVAVFSNGNGNKVETSITKKLYKSLGEKDGQKNNPKNTEYISLFEEFFATPAEAAIAFDTVATETGAAATSKTISFTMGAGANGILFITDQNNSSTDNTTGATYNGSACTQIKFYFATGEGNSFNAYGCLAPTSGTHNAVMNSSAADIRRMQVTSYTGVNQSLTMDSTPDGWNQASGANKVQAIVSTTDNAWGFMMGTINSAVTAGANTVVRTSSTGDWFVADTGVAQTPAGSFNMNLTFTSAGAGALFFAFAPAAATVPFIKIPDIIIFE